MSPAAATMRRLWTFMQASVPPPPPRFSAEDVPDQRGRVVVITGASSGLGRETARVLLAHNARVYIATRDAGRAARAMRELRAAAGSDVDVHFLHLNLASLASIKRAARELLGRERQIHVLYNNAGAMAVPVEWTTEDGWDLQFGISVVGHFYFTQLLLPTLLATAADADRGAVRIVTTSSLAHRFTPPGACISWDTLRNGTARRKVETMDLYSQAKSGSILLSKCLARRYGAKGILCIALEPGIIKTDLQRHLPTGVGAFCARVFFKDVALGALTLIYAGTSPDAKHLNGGYLVPWARVGKARVDHEDVSTQERLWTWLEEEVGAKTAPL